MNSATPLFGDQIDYGGDAACCLISCALARYHLQSGRNPRLDEIDLIIREGASCWAALDTGFMTVDQVLRLEPFSMLKTETFHCNSTGPILDEQDNVLAWDAKMMVHTWIQSLRKRPSVLIVTRAGYTFTICPFNSMYYVIDTHRNVLTQRKSAIDRTMRLEEPSSKSTGAMIAFYFPKDVAQYVVDFLPSEEADPRCNMSTNELELDQIQLSEPTKPQPKRGNVTIKHIPAHLAPSASLIATAEANHNMPLEYDSDDDVFYQKNSQK